MTTRLNTDPARIIGTICVGFPDDYAVESLDGETWPADTYLHFGPHSAPTLTLTATVATVTASWATTVANVTTLYTAYPGTTIPIRITTGAGSTLREKSAGYLSWRTDSDGSPTTQTLGSVLVGPSGESLAYVEDGTGGVIITASDALAVNLVEDGSGGLIITLD